jgi:hypothetical protein
MDFADRLRELAARIPNLRSADLLKTEEATKNALVMPFIQILGYDVFNPLEVTPELIADVGIKKGEKVDYAILKDTKPIMLYECKGFGVDLNKVHASQLYRYFSVTSVRFGIVTNGVVYRFHSDLIATNKMDDAPFFVFDLTSFNETHVETLKRFTKAAFDEATNIQMASNLKYRHAMRVYLESLFAEPTDNFIRHAVKESKAYEGVVTQNVVGEFTGIIREALAGIIREQVDKRLKSALASTEAEEKATEPIAPDTSEDEVRPDDAKIITTQDELDGYFVVKSIVREGIDAKRVTFRDFQNFCSILIDDSKKKNLCRLYFNRSIKHIGIVDENKVEQKYQIQTVDDIYNYADKLKAIVAQYANA